MTQQINLKLPAPLLAAAKRYVEAFGFRNIQELAMESIREKVFESGDYDEDISEQEILLIDRLIESTIKKNAIGTEAQLREALR